jgi:hypothetical protein
MKRRAALLGMLVAALVAAGCQRDVVAPGPTDKEKWDWAAGPFATGGGWEPNCEDSFVECVTTPSLSCTATVTRGGYVQCDLTITGITSSTTISVGQWTFNGGGSQIPGPTGGDQWSGTAVVGGTVSVPVTIDGLLWTPTPSASFTVENRPWSWASTVSGQAGSPGDIDVCMTATDGGLTASSHCTSPGSAGNLFYPSSISNGNGYTAAEVDGGPNDGLWYVSARTVTMELRTQLNKQWRADGPTYAMTGSSTVINACGSTPQRNHQAVNQVCTGINMPAYASFVSHVWSHEGSHLSAALGAAAASGGNLHALLEPLFSTSAAGLQTAAAGEFDDAHDHVFNAAAAIDTGQPIVFKPVWRNRGSGWASDSIPGHQ